MNRETTERLDLEAERCPVATSMARQALLKASGQTKTLVIETIEPALARNLTPMLTHMGIKGTVVCEQQTISEFMRNTWRDSGFDEDDFSDVTEHLTLTIMLEL